ncbi:MAG: DUF4124 domain-containing protein [Pseudomonadota bacterium]
MRTFILLAICCISFSAQAQAYRWVDSNGVVHYSDRPHEGAELIELDQSSARRNLPPAQDAPSSPAVTANTAPTTATNAPAAPPPAYSTLRIVSPEQGETLWNLGATLTVNLEFAPALRTNDRIRLVYDGARRTDLPADTGTITLNDVYRGAHTLKAQIEDIDGNVLIESSTKRFFVQQNVIRR